MLQKEALCRFTKTKYTLNYAYKYLLGILPLLICSCLILSVPRRYFEKLEDCNKYKI
jgi:hypothetical protein